MAKDLYESRQMYQGSGFFIFLIPVGMLLCFWLFDIFYGMYVEEKLKTDTQVVLTRMMERDGLETVEDYKEYAKKQYMEMGYPTDDLSVSFEDDYILLINYKPYLNMIGTVSFGLFHNETDLAAARYKGYYNEYKEVVIEEYLEDTDELIDDEIDDDEAVIIQ